MELYFSCALTFFLFIYFLSYCQQEINCVEAYKHMRKGTAFYCKNCGKVYLGCRDDIVLKCPNCSKENTKLRF